MNTTLDANQARMFMDFHYYETAPEGAWGAYQGILDAISAHAKSGQGSLILLKDALDHRSTFLLRKNGFILRDLEERECTALKCKGPAVRISWGGVPIYFKTAEDMAALSEKVRILENQFDMEMMIAHGEGKHHKLWGLNHRYHCTHCETSRVKESETQE